MSTEQYLQRLAARDPRYAHLFGGQFGIEKPEGPLPEAKRTVAAPGPRPQREPKPPRPQKPLLGDRIESALSSVGVTKEWVEQKLGRPCGCGERQKMFNDLDRWAREVGTGMASGAKERLLKLFHCDN